MSRGPTHGQVVRVGDLVRFEGAEYEVDGLAGVPQMMGTRSGRFRG
jgi:hypothetical protein